MTLRGDPTDGTKHFVQPKGGYHYASELIAAMSVNTAILV